MATPFHVEPLSGSKKGDRIGLFRSKPIPPVFMDNSISAALKIKQKELATLDERVKSERSRLERELATIDERASKQRAALEKQIALLSEAASITPTTTGESRTQRRLVNSKHEREELFQHRAAVMRRFLQEANGREVHIRELARELDRPISTLKDYYNEQPNVRPTECFWTNGIDGSHFRWKDAPTPVITADTPQSASSIESPPQLHPTR